MTYYKKNLLSKKVTSMNWHKFEYWPWQLVYFPVFLKYIYYSIREGSPLYFYAVNPGIETGGLLIESKYSILEKIPKKYRPEMQLVDLDKINLNKFPIIIKPNYGERGSKVEKITSKKQFEEYKQTNPYNQQYIVQEYVDLPFEVGIFYYRFPDSKKGVVSSLVIKGFLTVTGDGESTIRELMEKNFRAKKQIAQLENKINLDEILKKDEVKELEPIGNHSRGTTFLDGNHLITKELTKTFDELCLQIPGFYYGRFDIRAKDIEHTYKGDFKVLELNGAKSEPAHIYQPGHPIHKSYRSLFKHWSIMRRIAQQNRKNGHTYPTLKQGLKDYKTYKIHCCQPNYRK